MRLQKVIENKTKYQVVDLYISRMLVKISMK